MNNTPNSPSTSYTVLTQNPVHEVKNMSCRVENALMTLDNTYLAKLPLPPSCPVRINVLVKFRRLSKPECSEVSVGLQRMDKRRNVSIQMTYDLSLANRDKDIYAKKKAVIQLGCGNPTPDFVLTAKFTNSAIGGSNNDPDCIRLDTTILQALATKNLFVLNENQEIFFLLPGDVLFVVGDFAARCCCTMTRSIYDSTDEETVVNEAESKEGWKVFVQDLRAALDQGVQSDIQFKITDYEGNVRILKLHKFILAARSPYLRRIFEEHVDQLVYSWSVEKIVFFDVLVKYLYSGELYPLEDIWSQLKLYTMATDFEMESLRSECIKNVSKMMREEEVFDVLDVAVGLQDQVLKDLACDFIAGHQSVLESERFHVFVETKKELAAEVLKSILTKRMRR